MSIKVESTPIKVEEMPDAVPQAMPKAIYQQMGKSGLRVSVPILGAMSFGDKGRQAWKLEEAEALPLLKAAFDRGINTWDTANIYSNGVSEEIVGKAIKHYQIPRHKLVIMTKCYGLVLEDNKPHTLALKNPEHIVDYVNQRGLSRQAIFNAVHASLKRLGLEYIDVLQIHRFDPAVPIEETMKALHDLVESGKVRYIGASSMRAVSFASMQWCAEKNGWTKFVSMQNKYNLLYREEEREMHFFCNTTGVGLIPWGPLAFGTLARPLVKHRESLRGKGLPEISEVDQAIIQRVEQLAQRKGCSMSQIALAWINPMITSPIIGFSAVDRMDEAVGANSVTLTDDEVTWLEELYKAKPEENVATAHDPPRRRR